MKTFQYIFLLLIVAYNSVQAADSKSRIWGGEAAEEGFAPYLVSLRHETEGHYCGGSIINERIILTAAHCVDNATVNPGLLVVAGTNEWKKPGATYKIDKIISHSKYDGRRYDIAMISLASSIVWNDRTKPIKLAIENPSAGSAVIFAGWGRFKFTAVPEKLRKVTLRFVPHSECLLRKVFEGNICTYTKKGQGICDGDSGGSLVTEDKQYLIGIANWVIGNPSPGKGMECALGSPDVYANIVYHSKWIAETLKKLSED